ncbi:hypothetical protein D9757_006663 [Collybiopsis confluens]|uniref:Uncharacterized protein n=1 Tax=Collybiopsis confluens TaxID=2823264 RepID=A0A8H5HNS1_9AGAR|nr:hypothetical protein D9757_006663 [Collybiopsis confluens]
MLDSVPEDEPRPYITKAIKPAEYRDSLPYLINFVIGDVNTNPEGAF